MESKRRNVINELGCVGHSAGDITYKASNTITEAGFILYITTRTSERLQANILEF